MSLKSPRAEHVGSFVAPWERKSPQTLEGISKLPLPLACDELSRVGEGWGEGMFLGDSPLTQPLPEGERGFETGSRSSKRPWNAVARPRRLLKRCFAAVRRVPLALPVRISRLFGHWQSQWHTSKTVIEPLSTGPRATEPACQPTLRASDRAAASAAARHRPGLRASLAAI